MQMLRWMTVSLAVVGALLSSVPGCAAQTGSVPADAARRADAEYYAKDGTIQVVTGTGMGGVIRALNALYVAQHPTTKFIVREGDNYSSMAALTFDRSAFAALGTEYTRIGLGDNLKIAAEPVGFRIGHASLTPGPGVPALGVIVNKANPKSSLTMTQVTRMFAVGAPAGDIAVWGQAGVQGDLAERAVHPIGPLASDYLDSEDPQAGEFLSTDKMGGLNMNHTYLGLRRYADVVKQVSEDPAAIGIVALNIPLTDVKVIGLKQSDTGAAVLPSPTEIEAGHYPLDRFVYVYLRVGKGMPLDEFGKQYVAMILSDEGQRVIAAEAAGYLPLSPGELAEERAKLGR